MWSTDVRANPPGRLQNELGFTLGVKRFCILECRDLQLLPDTMTHIICLCISTHSSRHQQTLSERERASMIFTHGWLRVTWPIYHVTRSACSPCLTLIQKGSALQVCNLLTDTHTHSHKPASQPDYTSVCMITNATRLFTCHTSGPIGLMHC